MSADGAAPGEAVAGAPAPAPFARALLSVSLLCGIGFWATLPWLPYSGDIILKWAAIVAAAVFAFTRGARLTALGLALGSLGDVALQLDPKALFLYGMAAFAAGHAVYIAAWLPDREPWAALNARRRAAIGGVVLLALATIVALRPSIPAGLFTPVVVYMVLLLMMTGVAVAAKRPTPTLAVGAVLFLISDAVLAVHLFAAPDAAWLKPVIWPLYYGGQLGIAIGAAQTRRMPGA